MRTRRLVATLTAASCLAGLIIVTARHASFRRTTATTSPSATDDLPALLTDIESRAGDDEAGRALRAAVKKIRRHDSDTNNWIHLGDMLVLQARDTLDTKLYRMVERVYLHARQLDPTNAEALAGLAWAAGASHRFEDSVAWATLALKQDPALPAAYGILGDAAVELGRYEEAADHYQKMLDLRPDMGSYSRAAHLLYLEGNASRAIGLMRQAIRAGGSQPEHTAWCVAELSTMLCREGAAPAAAKLVEDALRRSPDNVALLAASGHARMAQGDDTGAIAAYERAVTRAPQHTALAALHDLYLAAGRRTDADLIALEIEKLYQSLQQQQVLGGDGAMARFHADRGERNAEAVRLAESEYTHHRGAIAADTLAWAYHRGGRNADAAKLLGVVLRHRAPDPAMLYHAGMIEDALGNFSAARRHLYAALSREPRFNPVHAPIAVATLNRLGSHRDPRELASSPP